MKLIMELRPFFSTLIKRKLSESCSSFQEHRLCSSTVSLYLRTSETTQHVGSGSSYPFMRNFSKAISHTEEGLHSGGEISMLC